MKQEELFKGTPHIEAKQSDFAKTVLMPGDPLRAEFIAKTFLKDVKKINGVRNMLGFTGTYNGKKVSIMGSGMGIPSIGIYSWELFKFYGVENIIRIGSCGATQKDVNLYDVVVGEVATSESSFAKAVLGKKYKKLFASSKLISLAKDTAKKIDLEGHKIHFGTIASSDAFYRQEIQANKYNNSLIKNSVLGIEMESLGLYVNALAQNKNAITILTASDHIITHETTTAKEREKAFTTMMKLALEMAYQL